MSRKHGRAGLSAVWGGRFNGLTGRYKMGRCISGWGFMRRDRIKDEVRGRKDRFFELPT